MNTSETSEATLEDFHGACDACKRRKVKCDRTRSCANCRISDLDCQRTIPPKKRGRRPTKKASKPLETAHRTSRSRPHTIREIASTSAASGATDTDPSTVSPLSSSILGDLEHQDRSTQDFSSIAFPVSDTPSVDIIVHLHDEFKAIHKALRSTLCLVLPADTVLQAVNGYIDMFTQYHFPNSPFIFESTLRSCASLLEHVDDGAYSVVLSDQLETMRKFTLITAMCAMVTSVMPESSVRNRHLLSVSFLHASRAMLHAYLDQDLEHPDSSSLIIRTWHSIALQNTSGKTGPAWHQHGEAALLAQRLRLQEEASFSRFPKKESQLLRAIFWQLYLTDVAAIATDTRPPIFHEAFSCGGPDVHQQGSQDEPFLDPRRLHNEGSLETRLITSWHYKIRIWSLAATIIRDVKRLENGPSGLIPDAGLTEEGASASKDLVHAYLRYSGLLDDLPVWIQKPDEAPDSADKQVRAYQSTCFWMQRCSIVSAFHCLKLIILQRCVEYGRPSVMGLTSNESTLAMKKIDIAYDFLRELQRVPFMCLKLQGEIQVQRIRRVGTAILQVQQTVDNQYISSRSDNILTEILDLLAKLDSKASDTLVTQL